VWNGYGPTETTVCSSQYRVIPESSPPCIGKPNANTAFYVLDQSNRPLPAGIPGELGIGGAGLSTGYLNRPDLSSGRFIDIDDDGKRRRIYKTGDLVQQLPSGNFRYLGRNDFQVKIRGFRIELGEIEAVMLSFPGIMESVCNVWELSEHDKRIVAYYTADRTIDDSLLKAHVKRNLPDYMVPGHFIALPSFPRTPSGKTDRKSLPIPEITGEATPREAPANALQQQILAVWSEVLGREIRRVDESFFDLGGHSLLVISMIRKLNARLGKKWRPRDLFDAPTVEGLAALSGDSGPAIESLTAIMPRADKSWAPLTTQQERLLFLHEMDPDKPLYNLVKVVKIEGLCDIPRLRRALGKFFDRHDIFRAFISSFDGRPSMSFHEQADIPLEEVDLSGLEGCDALARLNEYVRNLARTPMKFMNYPLSKAAIFKFPLETCYVCLLVPHIFADGWSIDIFFNELKDFYEHGADESWAAPPLPLDFGDYTAWDRDRENGESQSQSTLAFWSEYLSGIPVAHDLPLEHSRPKDMSGRGSSLAFSFDEGVSARVRALCERHSLTPNIFFLACFALLLRKYSAQETLVIGTPYANREEEELRGLFGYFICTIPLRFDVDEASGALEWLAYVKDQFLSAWEHSPIGLDELATLLRVPRITNINPIYQIMFAYQSYGSMLTEEGGGGGPRFTQPPFDRGLSENDLALSMWETERFEGAFDYSTDLFGAESVRAISENFARIAGALSMGFEGRLDHMDLMDAKAKELVDSTNRTGKPEFLGRSFLGLFDENLDSFREATAVKSEGEALTYGSLDSLSDDIARRLVAAGISKGRHAGVYMKRDRWLLPVLLGVFKSGAAYVPLEPSYPKDRLRGIVRDAGIGAVVTIDSLSTEAADLGESLLILSADAGAPARSIALPVVGPEQTAYLLFTSGSTGKPKGVPITHGALANLLQSMRSEPGMTRDDRVIALTTFTFDISTLEFFLPLTCGAMIVLADSETTFDNPKIVSLIEAEEITFVQATPSRWTLLLETGWRPRPGMTFLTGGEALPKLLADELLDTGAAVWNMYGPTETTVWSSLHRVERGDAAPSIGRPIANTAFHVLGREDRPLPAGMPGELGISGAGLSEGYLGRPDLSLGRFVEIDDGGERRRVYKTGDLVQQLPSGDFRYLGRNDFQVKIRGFRIELGEIEAAALDFPGVLEAACVVWTRSEQDKRLVLHYRASSPVDQAELRNHLGRTLPDYMVPGHFIDHELFPLTSSGKTDRNRLPDPVLGALPDSAAKLAVPRNDLESIVSSVWREVLGLARVAIDEDFFSLGGTSMLAMRMRARLKAEFGVDLPLRALFDHPTVEGIASALGRREKDESPVALTIAKGPDPTPWIGIMGIQLYEDIARALDGISSVLAIHVPARYVPGVDPFPSVEILAAKYIEVIRSRQPHGPYYLFGLCHGGVVAYEAAARLEAEGEKVPVVVLFDSALPEAYRSPPLRRLASLTRSFIREPLPLLGRGLARLSARLASLDRLLGRGSGSSRTEERGVPVDFPFEGPDIAADCRRYQRLDRFLNAEVLAFRATGGSSDPSRVFAPGMGWRRRARQVSCHDIPAEHLGIVRKPHAASIALLMREARTLAEGRETD